MAARLLPLVLLIAVVGVVALQYRRGSEPVRQEAARALVVSAPVVAVPEGPPVISQERLDAMRGVEISVLLADDTATGREKLRRQFKQWGTESPQAALAFLASHSELSTALRTRLAEALAAGWVLGEPDAAWQFALGREFPGLPMNRVVAMVNSLADARRFDTASRLLGDGVGYGIGSSLGLGVMSLATSWIVADPDAARAWIATLSSATLSNANLGVRIAEIRADPQKVITQLAAADAREGHDIAMALASLPADSGFDPVEILLAAPNAEDGRYESAVMGRMMASLGSTGGAPIVPAAAQKLLDRVTPQHRVPVVRNYVQSIAAYYPAEAVAFAKEYLTPDQSIDLLGRGLSTASAKGEDAEKAYNQLIEHVPESWKDPLFRAWKR